MKTKRKEFTPAKRKKVRRLIILWACLFLGIGGVAASLYIVIFSDVPKARHITVEGERLLEETGIIREAVASLKKESWWRNALGEEHILFWRSGEIRDIRASLPKVRSAFVRRSIQKRTVIINIREEEARGVWCAPEGRCFVFNEEGVLFAEAPRVSGYLITKIIGEEGAPISVGDEVLGNKGWFQNIRETIEGVEGAGIQVKAARLESRERKEWSIETAKGVTLLFGLEETPPHIRLLLGELEKEKQVVPGRVFDFRVPEKIYVR